MKLKHTATAAILTGLLFTSCDIQNPLTPTQDNASVALCLSHSSYQIPDRIFVNVSNDKGYNKTLESDFSNPGSLTFNDLPLGLVYVNVEAKKSEVLVLEGQKQKNIKAGKNNVIISLNNVLVTYNISSVQENQFDKNSTGTSPFWAAQSDKSKAILTNGGTTTVLVSMAYGDALYLLFEIKDDNFSIGQDLQDGEWMNDALVFYICHNAPYDQSFISGPIYKIQCRVGAAIAQQGDLQLQSFHTTPTIDVTNTISGWPDIAAKIITVSANNRILEMRIPREKFNMAGIGLPGEKLAIALRYNNSSGVTGKEKLDWKKKVLNPVSSLECWGILFFRPNQL